MDGPRPLKTEEFSRLIGFLDQQLRPEHDWSIHREYPTALNSQAVKNSYVIVDQEQFVSHALIRPLFVKSPAGVFQVAAIGSVVTSTPFRRQGFSHQIIMDCLQDARQRGYDFAILWTSLHSFYRKLGFELAGSEIAMAMNSELNEPMNSDVKVIEGAHISPEAVLRLFNRHTVNSIRSAQDISQYLQIPNSRIYSLWRENSILAFAVEGKGADLDGYIHEWGGNVPELLQLFSYIRRQQNRPLTIIVPAHSKNLLKHLEAKGCKRRDGYLGMIHPLNPGLLCTKLTRYARQLGVSELSFEYVRDKLYIQVGDQQFCTDSKADLTRLFFGPYRPSDIYPFDEKCRSLLEKILPIPFWIWGWDSV